MTDGTAHARHLSDGSELGILDVTCPLCDGKGRLSRTYLYEQLGVRDMAKLATHTAKVAVSELTDSLWRQYKDNLEEQVQAETGVLSRDIERLKAESLALEARNKSLSLSIVEKEEAARAAQKNEDKAAMLQERESLQKQITDLREDAGKLKTALEAAAEGKRLAVQAATQELIGKLNAADSERQSLAAKLAAVEQSLAVIQGAKQERAETTKGGIDFEIAAGEALRTRIAKLGDSYEETRNKTGGSIRNSKVGDHVHTLGPDSKGAGLRVVYECKKEAGYTQSDALKELAIARENRRAEVGVLIMAAATTRSDPKVAAEFAEPFVRHGNDLLIVWDHEDQRASFILDVVVSAARALAFRQVTEAAQEVDWTVIDRHLNGLAGQLKHFDDMKSWCGTIHDRTKDMEDRVRIMREQIERDCNKLREQLEALRP